MSKKILRKNILNIRKKNYKNYLKIKYLLLISLFKKLNIFKNKKIGGYFPINYEFDCFEILKKLEKAGYKISLPITKKKSRMDFFEWSFNEPLVIGKFGIPEPFKRKKIYPDVVLVPLVAFDKYKFRLGYGGGYYDRYIQYIKKNRKIISVGMAFSFQELKKIPINKNDQKLDFIFTENGFK